MTECILGEGRTCDTPDACAERKQCRVQAANEAEERRKLLAAHMDRGIVGAFQEFGKWCAINGVDIGKVMLGIACKDEETRLRLEALMESDRRVDDLTLRSKSTVEAINSRGSFTLMGVRGMIVVAPKEYHWPTN